jgi:hypothetical protein
MLVILIPTYGTLVSNYTNPQKHCVKKKKFLFKVPLHGLLLLGFEVPADEELKE